MRIAFWRKPKWATVRTVPLDSISPKAQALFAEGAAKYRAAYRMAPDEPLMVSLPWEPAPELQAILDDYSVEAH